MKDFWRFFAKLAVVVLLIVIIIAVVKKLQRASGNQDEDEQYENQKSENVFDTPKHVWGKAPNIPGSFISKTYEDNNFDDSTNKNQYPLSLMIQQLEASYAQLASELNKIEEKVTLQAKTLNASIVQTNTSILQLKQEISILNQTFGVHKADKFNFEASTQKTNGFPFTVSENSCFMNFSNGNKSITTDEDINMDFDDTDDEVAKCVLMERKPKIPFSRRITLQNPNDRYRLSVAGKMIPESVRFIIDIGINTKIALHFTPYFSEGRITLNTFDGTWQKEEYFSVHGLLDPDANCEIVITNEAAEHRIELNNQGKFSFKHRFNETALTRDIRISGGITLDVVTFELLLDKNSTSNSTTMDILMPLLVTI